MDRKVILGLFSILAIGLLIPAYADVSSPLKQYNMGIPIDEIQCNDGKVLVESSSGKPACVFEDTAEKLETRGWMIIDPYTITEILGSEIIESNTQQTISSGPGLMLEHDYTFTMSKYPKVGETAELILTGIHKEHYGYFDGENADGSFYKIPAPYPDDYLVPTVNLKIPSVEDKYQIFNVTSNIETSNRETFEVYSQDTSTLTKYGEKYTIKANVKILEEGFHSIYATGWGLDDIVKISIASSYNESKAWSEYLSSGNTYLSHLTSVRGESSEPEPEPLIDLSLSVDPILTQEESDYQWFSSLTTIYMSGNYTTDDIVEDLQELGYPKSDIINFLKKYMNYTATQIENIKIDDVSLETDSDVTGQSAVFPNMTSLSH